MKLNSTKNKLVVQDFGQVVKQKMKAFKALLFLTQFIAGNITLNFFHISNLDFINISQKREPISKFCLPVLDTE